MSLQSKQFYDFANFRLDISEKVLLRDGKPVPLTPKVFDTLCVLTENAGRLIEKDELMQKIWRDRFVEEGNLAFNIKVIRKALGDHATKPQFIETIPRRGYRFIAEVTQISENNDLPRPAAAPSLHKPTVGKSAVRRGKNFFSFPVLPILFILTACLVAFGTWYARGKFFAPTAPVLSAPFASEKLSTNGKVVHAVISPDGKNVVYTSGTRSDKESVWLRHLETGDNVEIIPASDDVYGGLAFSPDNSVLYFVRRPRFLTEELSIYRVSVFGGIPQKIVSQTEGWISISPDGAQISFVRCPQRDDENCSLWIADAADGANERKLTARQRPFRIADNKFSPDGESIVFAVGQSENAANDFGLTVIDLDTGAEREFSKEKFFNIKSLAWMPDQSGLLMTASKIPNKNFRIWQVSARTGEALPQTKDSETYSALSLDKDATKLVSTQIKQDFRARFLNPANSAVVRLPSSAFSVAYAPDGKIYFESNMSGSNEIWSVNPDGSGQRQLTNVAADETAPVVSPDGSAVFFASNRTGAAHVWRMNTDGSNQVQVTKQEGGFPLFVSPDGEWIYYHHGIARTLWRVSVKTGEEQVVFNKAKYRFAASPDATQIAYSEKQGDERVLIIAALANGRILKTFRLADKKARLLNIVWMSDGKNIAYVSANIDYENNILWRQPTDENAPPQQIAALGDDEMSEGVSLAVAPDGKTFAVVQGNWLHDAVLLKGLR